MFLQSIRQKTVKNLFLSFLILSLNGCVYMVVGGLGAVGGYVVSPDTVEGLITGHDFDDIWNSAVQVVSVLGVIQERDDKGGVLIAKIEQYKDNHHGVEDEFFGSQTVGQVTQILDAAYKDIPGSLYQGC